MNNIKVGIIRADRRGRLSINKISLDRKVEDVFGNGTVVQYRIKRIVPRNGNNPFEVAIPIKRVGVEDAPTIKTFKGVQVLRPIKEAKGVFQQVEDEDRWNGDSLEIVDHRNDRSRFNTADVKIKGYPDLDIIIGIEITQSKDQVTEPVLLLDTWEFRSNTKNVVVRPDWSNVLWRWESVGGHANISKHQNIFIIEAGKGIDSENKLGGGNWASKTVPSKRIGKTDTLVYPKDEYISAEEEVNNRLLRGAVKDKDVFIWRWDNHFEDISLEMSLKSPTSGDLLYIEENRHRRRIWRYSFRRLSELRWVLHKEMGTCLPQEILSKTEPEPETGSKRVFNFEDISIEMVLKEKRYSLSGGSTHFWALPDKIKAEDKVAVLRGIENLTKEGISFQGIKFNFEVPNKEVLG